jgi:hypothetical protein
VAHVTGDEAASGAGGHVGGEDVVGVPVEVLAGPVIAGSCAGIGVPGGDLDIAQVNPGIQTGREQCSNHAEYLSLDGARGVFSVGW